MNYLLMSVGATIANITKTIPIDSTRPKAVPKTIQLMITDAAGSVVAVIDASSGVKNFNPALKLWKAATVPKIIIQLTSKNTSGVRNGNQFLSSISTRRKRLARAILSDCRP